VVAGVVPNSVAFVDDSVHHPGDRFPAIHEEGDPDFRIVGEQIEQYRRQTRVPIVERQE
jgi:hypothetical protein